MPTRPFVARRRATRRGYPLAPRGAAAAGLSRRENRPRPGGTGSARRRASVQLTRDKSYCRLGCSRPPLLRACLVLLTCLCLSLSLSLPLSAGALSLSPCQSQTCCRRLRSVSRQPLLLTALCTPTFPPFPLSLTPSLSPSVANVAVEDSAVPVTDLAATGRAQPLSVALCLSLCTLRCQSPTLMLQTALGLSRRLSLSLCPSHPWLPQLFAADAAYEAHGGRLGDGSSTSAVQRLIALQFGMCRRFRTGV